MVNIGKVIGANMKSKQEFKMSQARFDELQKELNYLKTTRSDEVAEQIKVARGFGDLSENSEYDEAKNEQAIVEARIAELEATLRNVKILDEDDLTTEMIHVGSTIKVFDREFNEEVSYQIVGSTESDPMNGRLSDESPVGKALLGHKVGDVVDVEVPDGVVTFEILDIAK